jgi:hypothetical protein
MYYWVFYGLQLSVQSQSGDRKPLELSFYPLIAAFSAHFATGLLWLYDLLQPSSLTLDQPEY